MLAKIIKGKSFIGLVDYLFRETQQARIIGGQVYGNVESLENTAIDKAISSSEIITADTRGSIISELSSALNQQSGLNDRVRLVVRHFSINFPSEDGIPSDDLKLEVANRFMESMGYSDSLWLAVDHQRSDHNHEHFHIIAHAVDCEGKRISDSHDYGRARLALREIEQDLELTPFVSNLERDYPTEKVMVSLGRNKSFFDISQEEIEATIAIIESPKGTRIKGERGRNIAIRVGGKTYIETDDTGLIFYRSVELPPIITPDLVVTPEQTIFTEQDRTIEEFEPDIDD
jgi:hypothetical protein